MLRAPSASSASRRVALSLAGVAAVSPSATPNAIVCATNQLDWYTSVVGESPCRTYERLRQICDGNYTTGQFQTNAPGDSCSNTCCCNSIAWNLSMLCLNCQIAGSTTALPNGIDADTGSYGRYLAGSGVPTNGSLSEDIQRAVCTKQIDLRPTLYDTDWLDPAKSDSGAWYYSYFQGEMKAAFNTETGKNLTNCAGILSPPPTSIDPTGSLTPTLTPSTSSLMSVPSHDTLDVGAVTGGVTGGIVVLFCALLVLILWRRRRHRVYRIYGEVGSECGVPTPVPDPFMAGTSAPPPYAESPRKGELLAAPLYPSAPAPAPGGGGASSAGPGGRLGPSASTYDGSSTLGSWRTHSGPVAGSPEGEAAAVLRAKKSGWRLSEKQPHVDAQ